MDKYAEIRPGLTPELDDTKRAAKADPADEKELDRLADSPEQRLATQAKQEQRR